MPLQRWIRELSAREFRRVGPRHRLEVGSNLGSSHVSGGDQQRCGGVGSDAVSVYQLWSVGGVSVSLIRRIS
ncbi:hypothetical protein BJF90_01405 [Pseudonocardia sp. CNS-004]|nr:hypothetical protein BJF90_01405 [Pseudonocardia sp. CNS-004]